MKELQNKINYLGCLKSRPVKRFFSASFALTWLFLFSLNTARAELPAKVAGAEQEQVVTGKVTDASNGESIVGANIVIVGTNAGTVTDLDGNFSLNVGSPDAVLQITAIGYLTETVHVGGQFVIDIALILDITELDEVIVVGYGSQRKATVTGSVSSVQEEVFQDRGALSSPLAALQGQVPGVLVTRNSAAPGQENWSFQIRGATSTRGVDPLVIVDGVPMPGLSDLNTINPNDIESMSFLKDASAAIYGARSAAGVVLITTKRAKMGEPVVEYSGTVSLKRTGLTPSFISPDEYGEYLYQAIAGGSDNNTPDEGWLWTKYARAWMDRPESRYIDKQEPGVGDPIGFGDVQDYTFFDTNPIELLWNDRASSTQHDFSISARTDKMGYRLSLGYMDDGSLLRVGENSNSRYTARAVLDFTPVEKLNISTNISLEKNDLVIPTRQNLINDGSQPGFPETTINGNVYSWGTQPSRHQLIDFGGDNRGTKNRVNTNIKIEYTIIDDLKLVAQGGYNWHANVNSKQQNAITNLYSYAETFQYQDNPSQEESYLERSMSNNVYYNTFSYLEYNKVLNNHRLKVMAGTSYEINEYRRFSTKSKFLASNDVPALGLSLLGGVERSENGENAYHWGLGSLFGRLNYAYKDKYLVEINTRKDGTSKFNPDYRWKIYPGISAGWRLSEEEFMSNIAFLDDLKLRGSIGKVGNQNHPDIGNYNNLVTLQMLADGPVLGPYTSRSVRVLPNDTLVSFTRTWETIKTINIGVDFVVLGNRLSGSFDYFWKENPDMFLPQSYSVILGAIAPTDNIGHLKVWGWETSLGWRDKKGGVGYHVSATLSDDHNELIKYDQGDLISVNQLNIEGYPLNSYFGLAYDGRIQTDEQVAAYAKLLKGNSINMSQLESQVKQGINMFKDLNGDGRLTNAGIDEHNLELVDSLGNPIGDGDVKFLGDGDPHMIFAINLGMEWKGFDFSAVLQGVGKRKIYRDTPWSRPWQLLHVSQPDWWKDKTWTPENRDAELPILASGSNVGYGHQYTIYNYQISDWSLQNGAYVRLKNLVIGYTLPEKVLQKIRIDKVRFYVSGNDLWEFTKIRDGWDPEQSPKVSAGAERYPFYRMYTLGANVTF